jgi:hypothetical protein
LTVGVVSPAVKERAYNKTAKLLAWPHPLSVNGSVACFGTTIKPHDSSVEFPDSTRCSGQCDSPGSGNPAARSSTP